MIISLGWCTHPGRAGSLWEDRRCLICYDMDTQLDQWVQILQSAVRCQAALRGSSTRSEPVTHHIRITGKSEAFFLSNHFALQGVGYADEPLYSTLLTLFLCFLGRTKMEVLWLIWKPCLCVRISFLFFLFFLFLISAAALNKYRWKLNRNRPPHTTQCLVMTLFFLFISFLFFLLSITSFLSKRRRWFGGGGGVGGSGGANTDSF